MSGKTKTTLAIVLGVVGILLGVLGTITAYNAKDAVDSDVNSTAEVQALVETKFQEAQAKQDQLEASQKSDAEKFVSQLSQGNKNLLQKINQNHRRAQKTQRQTRTLRRQVNALKSRDNQFENELAQVENDQDSDYAQLNQRVNRLNKQVQQLQNQVSRLRGFVGG
jgi:predicted RNase H-like nuclease (RuvC/YqgF family)